LIGYKWAHFLGPSVLTSLSDLLPVIQVEHLSRRFGDILAVDDLSFEVNTGEVLGFLGPNGAGKSTTMKMVTGFLRPSSGHISVAGFDVAANPIEVQRRMGYLPEGAPCYGDMEVQDFLYFIASVRGRRRSAAAAAVSFAVEKLELGVVLNRRIGDLSKGFKRRVGLAQAVLHDPDILILDEPTDGLDPNQKHQVRQLIGDLSKEKIIIISTHILEEVTAVCSRAIIIADGRLVADDTPEALRTKSRLHNALRLEVEGSADIADTLAPVDGVAAVEEQGEGRYTILARDGQPILARVQARLHEAGIAAKSMYVEAGQLDDVFRQITQGRMA